MKKIVFCLIVPLLMSSSSGNNNGSYSNVFEVNLPSYCVTQTSGQRVFVLESNSNECEDIGWITLEYELVKLPIYELYAEKHQTYALNYRIDIEFNKDGSYKNGLFNWFTAQADKTRTFLTTVTVNANNTASVDDYINDSRQNSTLNKGVFIVDRDFILSNSEEFWEQLFIQHNGRNNESATCLYATLYFDYDKMTSTGYYKSAMQNAITERTSETTYSNGVIEVTDVYSYDTIASYAEIAAGDIFLYGEKEQSLLGFHCDNISESYAADGEGQITLYGIHNFIDDDANNTYSINVSMRTQVSSNTIGDDFDIYTDETVTLQLP